MFLYSDPKCCPPHRPGIYAAASGLPTSVQAGREIWYKATARNSRFHIYVFPQRLNVLVLVDWGDKVPMPRPSHRGREVPGCRQRLIHPLLYYGLR
ncbi:hypothetical protein SAMN05216403_101263 [Nitrosospira multiformis ATCC 25196]|uniref:Uncharacterized protein n=1 Tax=Nitrosospira multiformis (strain ATCC 25196 / NCIMB 11849 / C 71) TaxID=323848 RepID=A0A1H5RXB1_NITMU|nr:hypothetical protein [Nitrosospira multiformis]SEF42979.1 hypothetical protein SAMN05216403_101263 [Nitrosospira multiformis ATCC 25196]